MTIYDIPNIEHCDVSAVGAMGWRVSAHSGWYIHKSTTPDIEDENGNSKKVYHTFVAIHISEDLTGIEIIPESELPDNAEICGGGNDHEVM